MMDIYFTGSWKQIKDGGSRRGDFQRLLYWCVGMRKSRRKKEEGMLGICFVDSWELGGVRGMHRRGCWVSSH